ncbi:MAG: P1 family peptidase [Actinomycetota bacterium]|nr:P1 family peptidase [Actinomycetota bacterium]
MDSRTENHTITAVPGVEVGHYTDAEAMTGVTVLAFPSPNVAIVDVRGGGPGLRETGVLGDAIKPIPVNAIVFSGGSAFGLGSVDGVMAELEALGRGVPTPAGPVPIVPAAIIYDLAVGRSDIRPTPANGAAAFLARSAEPVEMGSVGAGTGATINKWGGTDAIEKAGVGSFAMRVGDATVGALVVLNAVGALVKRDLYDRSDPSANLVPGAEFGVAQNTTLITVAMNAGITDRNELRRIGIRAHDALGATVVPAHTRYDGDTVFVVSVGEGDPDANVDVVAEAAFRCVAESIRLAVAHS